MTSENIATRSEAEAVSAGVDDRFLNELVARAQAEGLRLTGEGGLLQQLTKRLLEAALEGEMSDPLGCDCHDPPEGPAATRGTASTPRRWSRTSGRPRSTCRVTVREYSSRRSSEVSALGGRQDGPVAVGKKGRTRGKISAHPAESMAPKHRSRRSPISAMEDVAENAPSSR